MSNDKDPPIAPLDYIGGLKVVDIGDIRIARGMSRRPHSSCQHRSLVFDSHERRIWCEDCERNIDPFDVVTLVAGHLDEALKEVARREAAVSEAEKFSIRSIAAKNMDEAWRSRNSVPSCPHCRKGLLPEDFKGRIGLVSKEMEVARRGRSK